MAVYVDPAAHAFGRMVMCHMWADTLAELLAMADAIGVRRKWLQQPPKASWVHFDICKSKRALALRRGAIETDRFGPAEHTARLEGNEKMLATIASCRARRAGPSARVQFLT